MNHPKLRTPRMARPHWLTTSTRPTRPARRAEEALMPSLYRSEAFGEDLAELYPELRFDTDTYPLPRSRAGLRRVLGGVAVAALWASSMVLATVVLIHNTVV